MSHFSVGDLVEYLHWGYTDFAYAVVIRTMDDGKLRVVPVEEWIRKRRTSINSVELLLALDSVQLMIVRFDLLVE
jgi:hypothetical protein